MSSKLVVIGAGYVGLPTAAVLAHLGHGVTCLDNSSAKINLLRNGEIPLEEQGLEELLKQGITRGQLQFSTVDHEDTPDIISRADFIFFCLPTPQGEDGSADLSAIRQVSTDLAPHLKSNAIIVLKSTAPVGTTQRVMEIIKRDDVTLVFSPEFLREGKAIHDLLHPDRIVIGCMNSDAAKAVDDLFAEIEAPRLFTTPESAEIIKYASNALLATKLSFINSISRLVDATGADMRAVTHGVGLDHRIGEAFLAPGPGWGGSCLPKDTAALVETYRHLGLSASLMEAVIAENTAQLDYVLAKIETYLPSEGIARVALFGLSFKAGTDDVRESPSLRILARLLAQGVAVAAYDPSVSTLRGYGPQTEYFDSAYQAATGVNALVIATEWPEFRELDYERIRESMTNPVIIDVRNILDAQLLMNLGFTYESIGHSALAESLE